MCVSAQTFVDQAWNELTIGNLDVMGGGQEIWQKWVDDVTSTAKGEETC